MLNEENDCEICAALKDFSNQIQTKLFFVIVEENETNKLLPLPCGRFLLAETEEMLLKRIQQKKSYVRAYCKNKMYTGSNIAAKLWVGDYKNGDTFEELAKNAEGVKKLGVLRADVDNLGQAFVKGFESEKNGNRYVTISRTATFSRKLSIFFKRYVNGLLRNGVYWLGGKSEPSERFAAVVYSGGDDVFIVGAWSDIIGFAVDLHNSLTRFAQETLTISAGIGIYPPKYPIVAMAREVEALEDAAKSYPEKNAVAIFNESNTYSWKIFIENVLGEKYRCLADFLIRIKRGAKRSCIIYWNISETAKTESTLRDLLIRWQDWSLTMMTMMNCRRSSTRSFQEKCINGFAAKPIGNSSLRQSISMYKRKATEFLEGLKQEYEKKEQMKNLEGDDILFVDFMEERFKTIRPTIKRATYGSYEQLYKSRIKPHFEKLNLAISEVKPQHIQALYDEILNESCGLGDKAQEKPAHCAVLCERGNGCPAGNGEGRPNLRPDFAGGILWLTAERGAWPALECGGF